MKIINKTSLLVALVSSFYFLVSLSLGKVSAEQSQVWFQKNLSYDIYYALQDGVHCVANVKIAGIAEINGVSFLQVQPLNLLDERSGYILFSSVRSILPTGTPRPQGYMIL